MAADDPWSLTAFLARGFTAIGGQPPGGTPTSHQVAAALATLDADDVILLELSDRLGLTLAEVAEVHGTSIADAERSLGLARDDFTEALRAAILFREGDPTCDVLALELAVVHAAPFSAVTVLTTSRHCRRCPACRHRVANVRAEPSLLALEPIAVAPEPVVRRTRALLSEEGARQARSQHGGPERRWGRIAAAAAVLVFVATTWRVIRGAQRRARNATPG